MSLTNVSTYELDIILTQVKTTIREAFSNEIALDPTTRSVVTDFIVQGKMLRAKLIFLSADLLNIPTELVTSAASSLEIFHSSTLILDDIQDQSETRRGRTCFYREFGIPVGIGIAALVRSHMYVPMELDQQLNSKQRLRVMQAFNQSVIQLCSGQLLDLTGNSDIKNVRTDQYFQMVENKTGALFQLAISIPAIIDNKSPELVQQLRSVGIKLGRMYQIIDDLLDISEEEQPDKDKFADLREGKFTLPVIHSLQHGPESRNELHALLTKKRFTHEDCSTYLQILNSTGSLEYSQSMVSILEEEILWDLTHLLNEHNELNLQPMKYFVEQLSKRGR